MRVRVINFKAIFLLDMCDSLWYRQKNDKRDSRNEKFRLSHSVAYFVSEMEINFSVLSHPFTRRWLILGGRKAINFEDACSMATFEVVLFQNPTLDLCPLSLELLAFARTGGDFSKTPKLELKMLEMLAFSFGFGCREGGKSESRVRSILARFHPRGSKDSGFLGGP